MRTVLFALAVLGGVALSAAPARAECVSDCSDAYQQAMSACQQKYPAPEQTDPLQDCMDDAEEQLESCTNDCESVD